jgi:O-antigen ligase
VKWIALSAVLLFAALLLVWLRENQKELPRVLMLMGFLPFALSPLHLYMAAISWPWPGYVQGAEFSVLDALALTVYFALPRTNNPLPFRISMAFYFAAALLSVLQARVWPPAIFYAWQLARMFLVYAAVARACRRPGCAPALLQGMATGLIMEAGVAMWERFGLGVLQASATADHQNLLGLTTHFAAFPLFALLLASRRGWVPPLGTLASVAIQALTTSRATVGLAALGYTAVLALSALRGWTARTVTIFLMALLTVGAITPYVWSSFERRFAVLAQFDSEYQEREAFERAASRMMSENPWGVGANHYVMVANVEGYNAIAGVAPTATSLGTNVHNLYLLVGAETGFLGMIALVLLLLSPMVVAFRYGFRNRGDERGEMLLGLGVALLAVYLHSFFEWIFVTFEAQYLWALDVGMVAGLAQQLGYRRKVETSVHSMFEGVRFRVDGVPIRHGAAHPGGSPDVRSSLRARTRTAQPALGPPLPPPDKIVMGDE